MSRAKLALVLMTVTSNPATAQGSPEQARTQGADTSGEPRGAVPHFHPDNRLARPTPGPLGWAQGPASVSPVSFPTSAAAGWPRNAGWNGAGPASAHPTGRTSLGRRQGPVEQFLPVPARESRRPVRRGPRRLLRSPASDCVAPRGPSPPFGAPSTHVTPPFCPHDSSTRQN